MNKIKLVIISSLLTTTLANAQYQKGSKHFGFNYELKIPDNNISIPNATLRPNFQYFIKDNFALSLNGTFVYKAADKSMPSAFSYEILPGFRKYFGEGKVRKYVFADIGFGQGFGTCIIYSSKEDFNINDISSQYRSYNYLNLRGRAGAGLQFAITDWLIIDFQLGVDYSHSLISNNISPSFKHAFESYVGVGIKIIIPDIKKKKRKPKYLKPMVS